MSAEKIRVRYQLYGEVQAVGLRYHAKQVADYYGLTGFVRNEYDGSVTAEIQGTHADVDSFLPALERSSRWIEIDRFDQKEIPPEEDERSFTIRY